MTPTKNLIQTRTFWSALAALVSALLAIFGQTDPRYSAAAGAVFAFLVVIFVRDGQLQAEDAAKQAVASAAAMPAKQLEPGRITVGQAEATRGGPL